MHLELIIYVPCIYLVISRVNVTLGETEERMMMTGSHVVADIFCVRCGSVVGWKYVRTTSLKKTVAFICLNLITIMWFIIRKLLTKRVRSTRKANLFLSGLSIFPDIYFQTIEISVKIAAWGTVVFSPFNTGSRFLAPMGVTIGWATERTLEEAMPTMLDYWIIKPDSYLYNSSPIVHS